MATKKITELPFIVTVSGSSVFDNPSVNSVVPVVLYGTTNQITVENFSKFTNLYAAQTGSQNIFTQNQWFNTTVSASTINVGTLGVGGNTTIAGTLGVTGNGTIGGNLAVAGRITAEEFYTEITTASVIYASGSTKFGDDTGDKHEFTGSINVSGSVIYNGVILSNIDANTIQRLQQTTQSLQVATASLQAFSSSVNDQLQRVYQTTQSLHVATASLQFHSASVDSQLLAIQQTTQSLQVATASLQQFTASQDSRNFVISQYTSSTDAHIVGISDFTSSQLAVNLGNAIYTASVDSHIVGISTYTSSVRDTLARVHQATQSLQVATASLQQFTASQDDRNFVVSQVTGSLIGITNGLMAFTAALDNTYATDAQLYQLYQATRSLELHSGSMVGVTNGLMAYTASNTTLNTGLRGEVDGIEAYTASLKGQAIVSSSTQVQNYDVFALNSNLYTSTGSLIGITNGLMAFTAALDSTYATDAQLYQLYQATRSIELTTGSLIGITNGLMAFTASLDNTFATDAQLYQLYQSTRSIELTTGSLIGITNGLMAFTAALDSTYATDAQLYQLYAETASIKAEIAGIEAYTASLKGAAIVSSSTQVQNYDVFALNSNLYNGTGSIKGEIAGIEAYTASLKGAIEVSGQNVNVLGMITAQQFNVTYVSSSVMYQSGSTEFGDSLDDRHLFTGSLNVSGGLLVTGTSTVTITANTAGNSTLNLVSTNNVNSGKIQLGGATFGATIEKNSLGADNGLIFNSYHGGAEGYTFQSNGTNVMKLNSAGRLGIGVLNVDGNTKIHLADSTQGFVGIRLSGSGDFTGTDWTLYASSDSAPSANDFFGIYNNSTTDIATAEYKLKVYKGGDVNITNGNLVIGTAGKGIDFSADGNLGGMTSELLDDYEEGTFTPFVEGSTTAGTGTYVHQTGVYTKIGNLVTCNVWLEWSAHSGTGNILLAGFPFTSISTTNFRASGTFGWFDNLTLTANNIASMAMSPSETKASLTQYPAGGGAASSVAMDTAANLHYSITYQTA